MGKFQNLENMIFGNWKVLRRAPNNTNGKKPVTMWTCECLICGKIKDVRGKTLKEGRSTQCMSCSHLNREYKNKKNNKYIEKDNYVVGLLKNGEEFYVDKEYFESISKYYWNKTKNGYLYTQRKDENIYLHRFIMNKTINDSLLREDYVDHINHNKLDNRKCNLRIVNQSKNQMNRIPTNDIKISGVNYDKKTKKYIATINKNKKKIHLGYFEKLDDAIRVRKEAEEKYFGEYSYDNSMKIAEENIKKIEKEIKEYE